jgi:hypothetical protein
LGNGTQRGENRIENDGVIRKLQFQCGIITNSNVFSAGRKNQQHQQQ